MSSAVSDELMMCVTAGMSGGEMDNYREARGMHQRTGGEMASEQRLENISI